MSPALGGLGGHFGSSAGSFLNGPQVGADEPGGRLRHQCGGDRRFPFHAGASVGGYRVFILLLRLALFKVQHKVALTIDPNIGHQLGAACKKSPQVHLPKAEGITGIVSLWGVYAPKFRGISAQSGQKGPSCSSSYTSPDPSRGAGHSKRWTPQKPSWVKSKPYQTPLTGQGWPEIWPPC